jgi:hypothetical protein
VGFLSTMWGFVMVIFAPRLQERFKLLIAELLREFEHPTHTCDESQFCVGIKGLDECSIKDFEQSCSMARIGQAPRYLKSRV